MIKIKRASAVALVVLLLFLISPAQSQNNDSYSIFRDIDRQVDSIDIKMEKEDSCSALKKYQDCLERLKNFQEKYPMCAPTFVQRDIERVENGIQRIQSPSEKMPEEIMNMPPPEKPAIYLYPVRDQNVEVKLDLKGRITRDIPKYNQGWKVFATKDGILDDRYDYLFYEADLDEKLELPEEGWVVSYGEIQKWFDAHLVQLGLNKKEKEQFEEYWMKRLPESAYYKIQQVSLESLEKGIKLIVAPKPDTVIRVMFAFTPLRQKEILKKPKIQTPQRNGFVVVEWGGFVYKN